MNAKRRKVDYPYLPSGVVIAEVNEDDIYLQEARNYALAHSLDANVPTGAVIVQDKKIIGYGANGSRYHQEYGCRRVQLDIPTGQNYELCEGCSTTNHAERRAILDAISKRHTTAGGMLYLWGHWWCCKPCWDIMLAAGIRRVCLQHNSRQLFRKA